MTLTQALSALLVIASLAALVLTLYLVRRRKSLRAGGVIAGMWVVDVLVLNLIICACLSGTCPIDRVALNVWSATASLHGMLSLIIYLVAFERV